MHRNSIEALEEMISSGKRKTMCCEIYELMCTQPPLTGRQIASRLGWDYHAATKRICDLLRDGVLVEDATIECPETGNSVRTVRVSNELDRRIAEQNRKIQTIGIDWSAEALADSAQEWCIKKGVPCDAYNVVLALINLGYMKDGK